MKRFFQSFWPLFFIISVWFLFASPYFLKDQVPYPSKYQVNFVPPWSSYEKFWGPVKNNAMPDIIGQLYPWRYFAINVWKTGQIPFWNPYSFAGNPHLANYQSAVFSPFNFLFFILPFIDAWSVLVLLQPILAGFLMYFLMREFKVSYSGSIISSVAFMFCGFMVVWMAYGTLSMAIAFLPLSLLALEKSFQKTNLRWLIVLSLTFPLSFFSGHFQTSLYFLIYTLAFFIFKAVQIKNKRKTIFVLLAIISGLIISLVQIFPSVEFYLHSVRSEIFIKKGMGIPLSYLITIFAPDFFGNPVTRNDWFGYYAEWASFIGILPLILAFYSLGKQKQALPSFFFFTGFFFLLLAIESPLQVFLATLKIPVLSTSNPSRIIVLLSFSLAVAAGFGLDNLKKLILTNKKKIRVIAPLFLFGLILALIWFLILIFKILPADKLIIAKRNLVLPTTLFILIVIMILLNLKLKKKFLVLFSSFILLFLVGFDSYRFAQKWMPFDPKALVFPSVPILYEIKKNLGFGRYFGNLGDQVNSYYEFSSIEGYDPLYIQRFGEFIGAADKGNFTESERSIVKLSRRGKYTNKVLDLLGVEIIFHPRADTYQGWAYPVWEDQKRFLLIYQDDKFQLFRNNFALPRASLFYDYEVIFDKKEIIKRFYDGKFDFRKKLILEEEILPLKKGTGSAEILKYTANEILIKTKTDRPALLFLADNYYPGWKASVDGLTTKIYRADYTFRAILVPKGESFVKFFYSWPF